MKKNRILIAAFMLLSFSTVLYAQKDRKFSNGFSINLVTGIPSSSYGTTSDRDIDSELQLGSIWGLQLGNRWYFSPKEKFGFGLMVNWLDITAGVKSGTESSYDRARSVADVSFLELGPVGTYALTQDIALDAYYNLRPTAFASVMLISDSGDDETYTYSGFGFTHALGAAFRYRALNIGLEYVMGSINSDGTYNLGKSSEKSLDSQKNVVNNFRIMIGAKF
jgi:hypothetical protein